jgi:hypothetical protein
MKTTRTFGQDSQSPGRDSNQTPLDIMSSALSLHQPSRINTIISAVSITTLSVSGITQGRLLGRLVKDMNFRVGGFLVHGASSGCRWRRRPPGMKNNSI